MVTIEPTKAIVEIKWPQMNFQVRLWSFCSIGR